MSLDSYNSQYPLAYYEVGTAYSFYCHNVGLPRLAEADAETVKKYSKALKSAIADNKGLIGGNGLYMAFTRAVGVVVAKQEKTNAEHDVDKIVVMFEVEGGKFVVEKYAVHTHDVYTNEKEAVAPAATIGAASDSKAPAAPVVTGPTVETTTGPTVVADTNKKSGPTVVNKSGPTVVE